MRKRSLVFRILTVAAWAVTVLVFGQISSQAETVIYEELGDLGNNATGIDDLQCGEDVFYDVTFVYDKGTAIYGDSGEGEFPFEELPDGTTRAKGVFALSVCIQNALNAAPVPIKYVGPLVQPDFSIAVAEFLGGDVPDLPGGTQFDDDLWLYGVFRSFNYSTGSGQVSRPLDTWVPFDSFPPTPLGSSWEIHTAETTWAVIGPAENSPPPPDVDIGGSVTGLTGGGLVLQNNGADDEEITADPGNDVPFTFDTQVKAGSGYSVTVKTQPSNPAQKCTVAQGSGIAPSGGVNDVLVTCGDEPEATATLVQRYRLYNPNTGVHFWTTDENEYNTLGGSGWNQEGASSRLVDSAATIDSVTATPYYRLYNPNTGIHFWTPDENEYNTLGDSGWTQEGEDGFIFPSQVSGSVPGYRLYNPNDGLHFWTLNENERNTLIDRGFNDEGIAGYVYLP